MAAVRGCTLESNFFLVYLICSAIRSRKVLPSLTVSKLLAFSSPMDVPSPPLSLRTAVWDSSFCRHRGTVYAWRIVYHKIWYAAVTAGYVVVQPFSTLVMPCVKASSRSAAESYLEVRLTSVLHIAQVGQLLDSLDISLRYLCAYIGFCRCLTVATDGLAASAVRTGTPPCRWRLRPAARS